MDPDDFTVGGIDALTGLAFIVEAKLSPTRCLLTSAEFAFGNKLVKVGGQSEGPEQGSWKYLSQGLILFEYTL